MIVEDVIAEVKAGFRETSVPPRISNQRFLNWVKERKLTQTQFLDELALKLARDFVDLNLDFDFCSATMADLAAIAVSECSPLFWEIYIAFDAGEFSPDGSWDTNPIDTQARPRIEAILQKLAGS